MSYGYIISYIYTLYAHNIYIYICVYMTYMLYTWSIKYLFYVK
jgi:hypothetical protein